MASGAVDRGQEWRGAFVVPWGAWGDDRLQRFQVPASWDVIRLEPAAAPPPLTDAEIEHALDSPIDAPPLEALVSSDSTVAIAIDDVTRPTPTRAILEPLVTRLLAAGVAPSALCIVIATGAHRGATAEDIEKKVGRALAGRVRVVSHSPDGALTDTGVDLAGTRIWLNAEFLRASVRIGVGAVMPHPFAAFSGGAKVVIPGLANVDVIARSHKFAMMGFHGGDDLAHNRFRLAIETAVRQIGLHWAIGAVVDAQRRLVALAAGDVVAAHRRASAHASEAGATPAPAASLDCLVVNAYPKDGEFIQMEAALVAVKRGMLGWLAPGAPILLMGACREGLGAHRLFGPGGRLYRAPAARAGLGSHPLWLFAPTVSGDEARLMFHQDSPFFADWSIMIDALSAALPREPRVGLVPAGPLQIPVGAGGGVATRMDVAPSILRNTPKGRS